MKLKNKTADRQLGNHDSHRLDPMKEPLKLNNTAKTVRKRRGR